MSLLSRVSLLTVPFTLVALAAIGCGSSNGAPQKGTTGTGIVQDSGVVDSGVREDAASDAGAPEASAESGAMMACPQPDGGFPAGYPATHAAFPDVINQGGGILAQPEVVTVTFLGDTLAPQLEQFGDDILQTCWWDSVRAGYCSGANGALPCIGRGVVPARSHVELTTAAAATYADADIQALIQQQVASGGFPAPDANTVYVIYFPKTTTISDQGLGTSCASFGGYHASTQVTPSGGSAATVAYAVVAECPVPPYFASALDQATFYASHEIAESASDPFMSAGYYLDFGNRSNDAWNLTAGGEIGDLCVDLVGESQDSPHDAFTAVGAHGSYHVQRIWSAAAAAAGGDPCVPVGPTDAPYFNTAIAMGQSTQSLTVGSSVTFEADAFSTEPGTTWSVSGFDWTAYNTQTPSSITVTTDKSTVSNGDKVMVTVKLNSTPPAIGQGFNGAVFLLISNSGTTFHTWSGLIIGN